MAIRMIATDLDNTLLPSDKQLTKRTIAALRAAQDAGALVVLSSGRMAESMTNYAHEIGVNAPIICYNGALTYDLELDRAVGEMLLDQETARALAEKLESMGQYIQGFWGNRYFYERFTDKSRGYAGKCGTEGTEIGQKLSQFIPCGVHKILVIAESGNIPKLIPELRASFDDTVDFLASSDTYLECVKKGVNKGVALRTLGAARGIAPSEIMTFGDEQNDLSMLTTVGYGYAMANASESIRRQVQFVAPSCTEDGVAQVIERHLEQGQFACPMREEKK